jgi:hypothetical protein
MRLAKNLVRLSMHGYSKTIRPLVGDGGLNQEIHVSVAGVYQT